MVIAIDPFMPKFDIRERFERRVSAPPSIVMKTAYEFDMQSIWLIWLIVNARKLILGGSFEKRRRSRKLVNSAGELWPKIKAG